MGQLVSVIIPVYNSEKYLAECIESILNQDYTDIEIILVNDGSKDGSLDICRRYECERVIIVNKANEGVSVARNVGIRSSKGDLLTFVDSDDKLTPDCISRMVSAFDKNNTDLVYGSFYYDYNGKLIPHSFRLNPGTYKSEFLLDKFIDDGTLSGFLMGSVWCGMYKRDVIEKHNLTFQDDIKLNEDGIFNFEYLLHAKRIEVIPGYIYLYRQYGNSSTKDATIGDLNIKIREYLDSLSWDKQKYFFKEQMKAREVSMALWDILKAKSKGSFFVSYRFIKRRISFDSVKEGFAFLNYNRMTKIKKIYAWLMKNQMCILLTVLIRCIQPIAISKLKR